MEAVQEQRQKASFGIPPTLLSTLLLPGEAEERPPCSRPDLTAPLPSQDTNLKTINGEAPVVNLSFQLLSSEVREMAWEGKTCVSSRSSQVLTHGAWVPGRRKCLLV